MYTLCKSIACCPPWNAFPNTLVMKEIQSGTEPEEEKNLQPMLEKRKKSVPRVSQPQSLGVLGGGHHVAMVPASVMPPRATLHQGGGLQR